MYILTIVFIIIFAVVYVQLQTRYISLSNVCEGSIAVVGNGPISKADRYFINSQNCIIRFNDQKNKLKDERTDVLVLRNNTIHLSQKDSTIWPVIPFCKTIEDYQVKYHKLIKPIHVYEDLCDDDRNVQEMKSKKVYNNCIKQNIHGNATSGISTGTAVLSSLQNDDNIESINVFGMNFNGGWWHVDFNDPNLSNICCTKCIFHKTRMEQYK
uniref:Uncharacterized protein n=1 Tax=viral metagenome TaxID=1070528 RepID=A0A6C0IY35_9ZZZZ